MTADPRPVFMSFDHVQIMNRQLAAGENVRAAMARLERRYVLAYELTGGPRGETIWWQLRFDPETGGSFTLTRPEHPADLTMIGDWREVMDDFIAQKDVADFRWRAVGDDSFVTTVAEAFAAVQAVPPTPTRFPTLEPH
jgi:hypothetical protein